MAMAAEKQNFMELKEALLDMAEYLTRVEQGSEQILQAVHTGNTETAIGLLMQTMEGFAYLILLTDTAAGLLDLEFTHFLIDEQTSVLALIEEIGKLNTEIVEAAENRDYSLLGDIVEYDLNQLTARAGKMVALFLQEMEKG